MKALTDDFERDKEIVLIRCNAKKTGKKGYRRKVVQIAHSESNWTFTPKEQVDGEVGFRSEFVLYRSADEYFLQIKGVSDQPSVFPTKYKALVFREPEECFAIINDKTNSDLYMSEPVLELLDNIQSSMYLTPDEKRLWEEGLIDEED